MSQQSNLWVVEWSHSQQCFHIDPLKKSLAANLAAYVENRPNDYQILAITRSIEEAHKVSLEIEKTAQEVRQAA